ncbi:MAG: hypothetical protein V4693_09840, partial [Pseudomonadota bacterium]
HSIHNAGVGGSSPPITTKDQLHNQRLSAQNARPFVFLLQACSLLLVHAVAIKLRTRRFELAQRWQTGGQQRQVAK